MRDGSGKGESGSTDLENGMIEQKGTEKASEWETHGFVRAAALLKASRYVEIGVFRKYAQSVTVHLHISTRKKDKTLTWQRNAEQGWSRLRHHRVEMLTPALSRVTREAVSKVDVLSRLEVKKKRQGIYLAVDGVQHIQKLRQEVV